MVGLANEIQEVGQSHVECGNEGCLFGKAVGLILEKSQTSPATSSGVVSVDYATDSLTSLLTTARITFDFLFSTQVTFLTKMELFLSAWPIVAIFLALKFLYPLYSWKTYMFSLPL